MTRANDFDTVAARLRCLSYRRRILGVAHAVQAAHVAPAFSCLEMVDAIYYGLKGEHDHFLISKGHGVLAQYAVLEGLGILSPEELDRYDTLDGRLAAHPDRGVPGIEASTGSLGHGMALAAGMALAERLQGTMGSIHVLLSDGEFQEGSTWEAMMMAANLKLGNLVAYLDLNDFQGLGRTSQTHPAFYPVLDKVRAFGWEAQEANGHDAGMVVSKVRDRQGGKPFLLVGKTVKGRGVSFMENQPIWHYRSPNDQEYRQALDELHEVSS
ncbi:MAG: transketolase [Alphaproteobacteria bacterium]|nr:transketolase [Alphaproteobacteria bacterium]